MIFRQSKVSRCFVGTLLALVSLAPGGQEVGNGGDPLFLIMRKARVDALTVVKAFAASDPMRPEVRAQFTDDVYEFLLPPQGPMVYPQLMRDIELSEHEFLASSEQSTCARTNLPDRPAGTVVFSLEICRALVEEDGEEMAVQLLIHEAVHHFGVGGSVAEETFATRVAEELVGFWQHQQQANAPQWRALTMQRGPESRYQATAVGLDDGSLFVWGGCNGSSLPLQESCERFLNDGKIFRSSGDVGTWTDVSDAAAPLGRKLATGVYTGDQGDEAASHRVIVWGGCRGDNAGCEQQLNDGGIFDVESNAWESLPPVAAPGRVRHSAVWTGREMIVYGGRVTTAAAPFSEVLNDLWILGHSATDGWQWRRVAVPGHILGRFGHSAVWAGDRLVVYGGCGKVGLFSCQKLLNDAFTFDPATSKFKVLGSIPEGSAGRLYASVVWNGTHAIFWGGQVAGNVPADDGLILDLATPMESWTRIDALLPSGEPAGRYFHQASWTGDSMLIYGGVTEDGEFSQKVLQFRYLTNDPTQQSWRMVETPTEPIGRKEHAQVWTEAGLVVWGGYGALNTFLPTGGILRNVR